MSRAPFKPAEEVDFIVIGAGAAGGVMAKELAVAGLSVVVLEQGPYLRERDFKHDEFGVTFQPAMTNNIKRQPNTYRKTESERQFCSSASSMDGKSAAARFISPPITGASMRATSGSAVCSDR